MFGMRCIWWKVEIGHPLGCRVCGKLFGAYALLILVALLLIEAGNDESRVLVGGIIVDLTGF